MRVALVGPVYPYRGGIAHYTTMLYRALRARGHDVLMVSFKRQYPQWLYPGRSDKDPSKEPLIVEDAKYWIDSLNPITWLTTFWHIRRYQPDVLVLQWWTTFWAPVWWTLGVLNLYFLAKPCTYICHNVLPHEVRGGDKWITWMTLRLGTRFIVHSPEEGTRLKILLSSNAQIEIVPLPIFNIFAREGRIPKEKARRQMGLPIDVPVLLFFGIVREYKGLRDVLCAMPEVQAHLGKTILLIVGEFWEDKQRYLKLIEQLRISDLVLIEDRYIPNEEISLYFSAADVLVAPYHHFTGSAVLRMAQYFGIPIITTLPKEAFESTDGILFAEEPSMLAEVIVRYFAAHGPLYSHHSRCDYLSSWTRLVKALER